MLGLIFPGQGSQFVGMGKVFYENFKDVKHTFDEGSDALQINLKKLLFDGPDSDLKLTHNTQPAILLVSVALDRILKDILKEKKKICAGHSLGEYSALVSNGVLDFAEAIKTVRIRGELMQKAVPPGEGAMIAVLGCENENVEKICQWVQKESKEILEPANYNAPGQVVISGSAKAGEWLMANWKTSELATQIKAKFIPLNVSAPFHCSMMMPAQLEMTPVISKLKYSLAKFPVVQNVTAMPTSEANEIQKNLISQISAPVKWVQSVIKLRELGVTRCIEVGPGKVLSGLVKKIDSEALSTLNIETIEDFKKLEADL
ncbi:MAG: ACP S-malonyltransferase [Bdellovibrionota bacterium]